MQKYWKVEGYSSANLIFERLVPEGELSASEIEVLLQRLACRHLSEDKIVAASLRQNSPGYIDHLRVAKNQGGSFGFYTKGNPMYTARIVNAEMEKRLVGGKPDRMEKANKGKLT